jgi:thiol-disulfide isomerase/thioredoxin
MPSNNNRKSMTNKTSNTIGSSNTNWAMLSFVSLAIILFVAYYFAYKNNRETETKAEAFENDKPDLKVSSGEKVVALFYADWCPHCVDFKPHYKKAMSKLNGKKNKGKTLRFVMVDCDKYKSLASENDVGGFPTVKILNDDKTSDEYSGDRSYEGLTSYFS